MSTSLISGSPWRVILAYSVPLLIGNVVQQLYHFADAIVVGRHLGVNSLAAVGATGSLIFLLLGFAWGMTSGFAIPTAQAYGAQDHAAVRRSVATGTVLTGAVTVLLTIAAPLVAEPALRLLQTPAELLPEATAFTQISFLGTAALMFFNYLSAIIRAIGDSRTPLVFLTISCALNVVLVLLMVGVFEWGVGGAALATVIAQAVSVVMCLEFVRRRVPVLHLRRDDWRITRDDIAQHLRLGLPMGFQASIISIGAIAVQIRLNELGTDAVAAFTTASRVDGLPAAFLASLGLAVSMYAAQNLGAGRLDRIRSGVVQSIWMSIVASIVFGGLLILTGTFLIRMFVGDGAEQVVDMAFQLLVINGSTYTMLGVLFVIRGALQGLGHTFIPTVAGIVELVARVGVAVVLGALFGFVGVVWSNPMAWLGAIIVLIPAYVRAHRSFALAPTPTSSTDAVSVGTQPIAIVGPMDGELVATAMVPQAITGAVPIISVPRRRSLLRRR